jgi:hypothetical protein
MKFITCNSQTQNVNLDLVERFYKFNFEFKTTDKFVIKFITIGNREIIWSFSSEEERDKIMSKINTLAEVVNLSSPLKF